MKGDVAIWLNAPNLDFCITTTTRKGERERESLENGILRILQIWSDQMGKIWKTNKFILLSFITFHKRRI